MAETVNIFIASNGRTETKALAQCLADAIRTRPNASFALSPKLWWDIPKSDFILESVRIEMKNCDFAAMLLTPSDLDVLKSSPTTDPKAEDKDSKTILPYNVLIEIGLFIGDVDDHQRCFILTTVDKKDLPSDLDGLIFIPLANDNDSLNSAVADIFRKVGQFHSSREGLRAIRGLRRATYPMEELYRRETVTTKGGKIETNGAVIFVNTPEPVEMRNKEFSHRVVENILKHKMHYTYVFRECKNFETMGSGIVSIFSEVKELDKNRFNDNIVVLSKKLNIYFSSFYGGLEFCIHDAESDMRAKCYMRCRHQTKNATHDFWIDWGEQQQAAKFMKLIELIQLPDENCLRRIFHNTLEFKIMTDEYRSLTPFGCKLKEAILDAISDLPDDRKFPAEETEVILKACFYGCER